MCPLTRVSGMRMICNHAYAIIRSRKGGEVQEEKRAEKMRKAKGFRDSIPSSFCIRAVHNSLLKIEVTARKNATARPGEIEINR